GVAHYAVDDDEACLAKLRDLVSVLPTEHRWGEPGGAADDPRRSQLDELYDLLPNDHRMSNDMQQLVGAIVDGGKRDECWGHLAREMICGDARIDGVAVGV